MAGEAHASIEDPILTLHNLNKWFGNVHAVDDVSIEVHRGEFVSLLGPSGCGKTTTLRMIAGFEGVSSGEIRLEGRDIAGDPPHRRHTAMVFQSYALFPHMTVEENVSFGLRMHKAARSLISARVEEALALTNLSGLERRYPRELSGGQQQRVAVARALAVRPVLLLLDEPLSNLDAKLRERMRVDLRVIQRETGITTVFVTHDQEEALTMSDRIVVMVDGRVAEVGTPWEIYHSPSHPFSAGFIGHVNVLRGVVSQTAGQHVVVETDRGLRVTGRSGIVLHVGDQVCVCVKEERVHIRAAAEAGEGVGAENAVPARVRLVTFLGSSVQYVCNVEGQDVNSRQADEGVLPTLSIDASVSLAWSADDCVVVRASS